MARHHSNGERLGPMKEFRAFILRGNLVDLAVAFVVGAAFATLVKSLVADFITPLIAAMTGGKTPFESLVVTVHGQALHYGDFLNNLLSFVIVAAVIFFLVVKPVGAMMRRFGYGPPAAPQLSPCPRCETQISPTATKCPACTADLTAGWSAPAASSDQ
ncbi:MAG TPA: large conductance mechanosensitive channel protein MscL [Acidimicrobiales bacterium]|nr:large conductance mechanosensitive channel protein MscL [Acidimicrobiales bacterium]